MTGAGTDIARDRGVRPQRRVVAVPSDVAPPGRRVITLSQFRDLILRMTGRHADAEVALRGTPVGRRRRR